MTAYESALGWLLSLPDWERGTGPRATREGLYLARPAALLEALASPQRQYRTVLIAGTKGKGSTAAMLECILRAGGYRTGSYTQPHLHTFRERIRVQGELISADTLTALLTKLEELVSRLEQEQPELERFTTFEVTTALALLHFALERVDVAVLEVGLGGRLDATNVVDADLALITAVSYDHTHVLGDRLSQIAREKAGIIKPGKPVLTTTQPDEVLDEIQAVAALRHAPLGVAGRDWLWLGDHDSYMVAGSPREGLWSRVWHDREMQVPLRGVHQLENAALAVAGAHALGETAGLTVGASPIAKGLAATRWPGRLEVLQERDRSHPLLVADGAHNGDSAEKLAAALRFHFKFERLWLVLSVLGDKHLDAIAAPFCGNTIHAWTVQTRHPRSRDARQVADELVRCGMPAEAAPGTRDAIRSALAAAAPQDLVCVTGSLSIVAEAREAMGAPGATVD